MFGLPMYAVLSRSCSYVCFFLIILNNKQLNEYVFGDRTAFGLSMHIGMGLVTDARYAGRCTLCFVCSVVDDCLRINFNKSKQLKHNAHWLGDGTTFGFSMRMGMDVMQGQMCLRLF